MNTCHGLCKDYPNQNKAGRGLYRNNGVFCRNCELGFTLPDYNMISCPCCGGHVRKKKKIAPNEHKYALLKEEIVLVIKK